VIVNQIVLGTLSGHSSGIVLASASPRRQTLLSLLGLDFAIQKPNVDEQQFDGEAPTDLVQRLSLAKAQAAEPGSATIIVAADTIVVLDGQVLGKPPTPEAAIHMLKRLRGRQHTVHTGLAVLDVRHGYDISAQATTAVEMRDYSDEAIRRYVATGGPMDKAGAYAIQSETFDPVARILDCYANVVGLPLCHLYRALDTLHHTPPVHPLACCPMAVSQGCPWAWPILHSTMTAAPARNRRPFESSRNPLGH